MRVLIAAFFCILSKAYSQPCINNISTNPHNPINNQFIPLMNQWFPGETSYTHNPFLNTHFSWYLDYGTIFLYPSTNNWSHPWSGNPDSVAMINPFSSAMPSQFSYLRPNDVSALNRDYKWEDGWELLWMNMGYFPDGYSISNPAPGSYYADYQRSYDPAPEDIPYFILYNRYRGLMRVIAKLWYDDENFRNVEVVLKFPDINPGEKKLTGILRHASATDLPLDQPTEITAIHSPRYRAPNFTQWMVADFQIGYDPCTCISRGELVLEFHAFNTMEVDIVGRTISGDQPITEADYTSKNFLNLSGVNEGYVSGTEVYQKMGNLFNQYKKNLEAYNENLADYNAWNNSIIREGISSANNYLTNGLADLAITDSLITWLYKNSSDTNQNLINISEVDTSNFEKKLTDQTKKALGGGFDFLSAQLNGPKPDKPKTSTIPVATYEESVYNGTITRVTTSKTLPLYIPGTIPNGYGSTIVDLSPYKFPAYNEVLGLVSLLKTPNAKIHMESKSAAPFWADYESSQFGGECFWEQRVSLKNNFSFRFTDNIDLALNPALDFDLSQTKSYVLLEIEIQNDAWQSYNPILQSGSNMHLVNSYKNSPNSRVVKNVYQSEWIDLELINQMVFSLKDSSQDTLFGIGYSSGSNCSWETNPYQEGDITSRINYIKVKILNDMYFNQIGTNDEPVNTTQSFSYILYDKEKGINHLSNVSEWSSQPVSGHFDKYIPGFVNLDSTNYSIWPEHPYITEVGAGGLLYIDAENVVISHDLVILPGYHLIIRTLNEIKVKSGVRLTPDVHLKIKRDYYPTPIFEYADNNFIYDFCNDNNQYHANISSANLQKSDHDNKRVLVDNSLEKKGINQVSIYPNPANTQIWIRSTSLPISEIQIIDLAGRIVIHEKPEDENVKKILMNTNTLQAGIYIVKTQCENAWSSQKLVIGR